MLTHSSAPVPRPLAFPFTPEESAAAAWACTCASLLLGRGAADGDPEATALQATLPHLPGALRAIRSGHLTGQDMAAVAAALVALCQMRDQLAPGVWAALLPPPSGALGSARVKALALDSRTVGRVQA